MNEYISTCVRVYLGIRVKNTELAKMLKDAAHCLKYAGVYKFMRYLQKLNTTYTLVYGSIKI